MKIILSTIACATDEFNFEIEGNSQNLEQDRYVWKVEIDGVEGSYYYFTYNPDDDDDSSAHEYHGITPRLHLDLGSDHSRFLNKEVVITATKEGTSETTTSTFLFPFDFPYKWPTTRTEGVKIGGLAYEKNKIIRVNVTLNSTGNSRAESPPLKAYDQGGYGVNDAPPLWTITPDNNVVVLSETATYIELISSETGYLNFEYLYTPEGDSCHDVYDLSDNAYIGMGNPNFPTHLVQGDITGATTGVCNGVPTRYVANTTGTVADSTKRYEWSSATDPDIIIDQNSSSDSDVYITFSKSGASGLQNLQCEITSTDTDCLNSVINTTFVAVENCVPPDPILKAFFAVQRGGQQFSCKGNELKDKLQDGDTLVVQRGADSYQYEPDLDAIGKPTEPEITGVGVVEIGVGLNYSGNYGGQNLNLSLDNPQDDNCPTYITDPAGVRTRLGASKSFQYPALDGDSVVTTEQTCGAQGTLHIGGYGCALKKFDIIQQGLVDLSYLMKTTGGREACLVDFSNASDTIYPSNLERLISAGEHPLHKGLDKLDVRYCENFNHTFRNINEDLYNQIKDWDMSNARDMTYMFRDTYNVGGYDFSHWKIPHIPSQPEGWGWIPNEYQPQWGVAPPTGGGGDALLDTDLLACTDTNGVTYKVTGARFKELFEAEEIGPLTLVENPTIELNGNTYTVATNSYVTGGKRSYTYENEWFGTALTTVQNQEKSYNIGINNKGQAVAPTSTIADVPKPRPLFYTTVDSGLTWPGVFTAPDPTWGSKGNILWDDVHKCFICGSLLDSSNSTVHEHEGIRIVYPEDASKNTFVHLDMDYALVSRSPNCERFYDVRKHPTLEDAYTATTSGVANRGSQQEQTIVVFTIDFDTMTGEIIDTLGPVRTSTSGAMFGRSYCEHNGVGYFVCGNYNSIGEIFVNNSGLYSKAGTWESYPHPLSIDYGEVCFIQNDVFVSTIDSRSHVYKFDVDAGTFTKVADNEFWRQIGDYVYKAAIDGVDRVNTADGSSVHIASYSRQLNAPMYVEYAGGDIAVIFMDGKIMFSDAGTVLGTGDSVTSNDSVMLKQTVTDQEGDFVIGSATAEVGSP